MGKINKDSIEFSDEELAIFEELGDDEVLSLAKGEDVEDDDSKPEDGDEDIESEDDDLENDEDDEADDDELEEEDEESEDDEPEEEESEPDNKLAAKAAAAERRKFKKRMAKERERYESEISALRTQLDEVKPADRITNMLSKVTGKKREDLEEHIINSQKQALIRDGMNAELAERYSRDMMSEFSRKADEAKAPDKTQELSSLKADAQALAKKKLYRGLNDHIDEVARFAERSGISVESAYHALYHEEYTEQLRRAESLERKHKQSKRSKHKVGKSQGQRNRKPKQRNLTDDQIAFYQENGLDLDEMELLNAGPDLYSYRNATAKE